MGRGRAKAKQVKVARQLKYSGGGMDLDQLRAEFGVGTEQQDAEDRSAYADFANRYSVDEDEDDDEDEDAVDDEGRLRRRRRRPRRPTAMDDLTANLDDLGRQTTSTRISATRTTSTTRTTSLRTSTTRTIRPRGLRA